MCNCSPPADAGDIGPLMSVLITLPGTTCSIRMAVSLSLASGLTRLSTVPAGSLANASSGRREDGERPGTLQGLNETGGSDGRDKRLERTGGDGGIDNVMGGDR